MTKLLTFVNIGNMNLKNRRTYPRHRIRNCHGGMRVASCIEQDPLVGKAHLMNFVNNLSLNIALKIIQLNLRKLLSERIQIRFKRLATVHFRFPLSQKIEIGTVNDLNFHERSIRD